jgi:prepilin-type N-terminal cleavage/methylation domain-containing protein
MALITRHQPRAFTLIEMLVIIAIIAVLIAILMPSLNQAKYEARTAMCASNLRQFGIGLTTYGADHHGFYPHDYTDTPHMQSPPGTEVRYRNDFKPWVIRSKNQFNYVPVIQPYFGRGLDRLVLCPHIEEDWKEKYNGIEITKSTNAWLISYSMFFNLYTNGVGINRPMRKINEGWGLVRNTKNFGDLPEDARFSVVAGDATGPMDHRHGRQPPHTQQLFPRLRQRRRHRLLAEPTDQCELPLPRRQRRTLRTDLVGGQIPRNFHPPSAQPIRLDRTDRSNRTLARGDLSNLHMEDLAHVSEHATRPRLHPHRTAGDRGDHRRADCCASALVSPSAVSGPPHHLCEQPASDHAGDTDLCHGFSRAISSRRILARLAL